MNSNQLLVGLLGSAGRLELDRRPVVEIAVQPFVVAPVDPPEDGELNVLDGVPGALPGASDELGLGEGVDRLGEGVIERVPDGPDRRHHADVGQAFAGADGRAL
jgi:hypothetical protein